MKHKVKMLKSLRGVHDGELHPIDFLEGEEYHVGDNLLQGFVNAGAVELVGIDGKPGSDDSDESESDAPADDGEKSEGDAPENKAMKAAPENKKKSK